MRTVSRSVLAGTCAALLGCAEFPEKYENVIADGKIRPFSIIVEPPEAAPGDTVKVRLQLYDAGKSPDVDWELALKFQLNQGTTSSSFPNASETIDLDKSDLVFDRSSDGLSFSLVIPRGARNPLRLTDLSPDLIKPETEISAEEKAALAELGIASLSGGLRKAELVEALDSAARIPNALSPMVDGLIALVRINAKVSSPGFTLDVAKNLTVRYSNRLATGSYPSNVNGNPVIDSVGLIHVHAGGIVDFAEIPEHVSDTAYFTIGSANDPLALAPDTLRIVPGDSYFLYAVARQADQAYRSPAGKAHREQLGFQWFYTNLDAAGTDWEELLVFPEAERALDLPIVPIQFPAEPKGLRHFLIRATLGDSRPEWGALSATGLDYKSMHGYILYP
jgi:hypothetical protein